MKEMRRNQQNEDKGTECAPSYVVIDKSDEKESDGQTGFTVMFD